MSDQYSVIITGLAKNIPDVNFITGENVYHDDFGNLSHDSAGNYIGCAVKPDAMVIRPDFIENPTISRKYEAETPVDGKVVQIDINTKLVSPLPLKQQGISINSIPNTISTNLVDKHFFKVKDNLILLVARNPSTYKGVLQLYQYNNGSIIELGESANFFKNTLTEIRGVVKWNDQIMVIFNDYESDITNTYSIGIQIDNNSLIVGTPLKLDDVLASGDEHSYLYHVSDNKVLHVYNFNVYSGSGYTKAQLLDFNPISGLITKTTPVILQNDVNTVSKGDVIINDNIFKLIYSGKKVSNNNEYCLMTVFFSIDGNNIIKQNEVIVTNGLLSNIRCKYLNDGYFLMLYDSFDGSIRFNLAIGKVNTDNTITIGQQYINLVGTDSFLDDTLINNSIYYRAAGVTYQVKYEYDLENDIITYENNQCLGQINGTSKIIKVNKNKFLCATDNTIRDIKNTDTRIAGFYKNGMIYFGGFVPNVSDFIQNGIPYYWDSNGDYTTDSSDKPLLALGLNKGLYIFEKDHNIPSSLSYELTASSNPANEIKLGQSKTYTVTKNSNGLVDAGAVFTYSFDYMNNSSAIVSITSSTARSVTLKASSSSSYVGKQFKLICTDTANGRTVEQLITVRSLF